MMKSRKVEFMPPQPFSPPEGSASVGDEFTMVCDFKITPNGVCLIKMGDTDMPGYGDKDSGGSGNKQSYADYAASMQQMGNQQPQQQ